MRSARIPRFYPFVPKRPVPLGFFRPARGSKGTAAQYAPIRGAFGKRDRKRCGIKTRACGKTGLLQAAHKNHKPLRRGLLSKSAAACILQAAALCTVLICFFPGRRGMCEMEALTRCFLPKIQKLFESGEGQRKFAAARKTKKEIYARLIAQQGAFH
jgi:hypothetical protein